MSNSTDNFGSTGPFSEENSDQHQWKPEPSEDNPESSSEDSGISEDNFDLSSENPGTSGEYTDHPGSESLLNPYGKDLEPLDVPQPTLATTYKTSSTQWVAEAREQVQSRRRRSKSKIYQKLQKVTNGISAKTVR
jgi:hypothetical protein